MPTALEDSPPRGRLHRMTQAVWLRVVVTLALLGLVGSRIDWNQVGSRLSHGHPLDFVAAVGVVGVALAVGVYRWWRLLHKAGVHLGLLSLGRIYAVSTFSNTFLPTSVGGDVTRALLVVRRGPVLTRVATTIVIDRLGGLAGLLGIAWITLAFQSTNVPSGSRVFLAWVTIAIFVGSLVVMAAVTRGSGVARSLVPARLVATARECRSLLRTFARDPRTLVMLLLTSLLFQTLISLQLMLLARAIDVQLSFSTAAVVLALVTVVTLIPISIGGFGVREGSYVVLLGGASIVATDATLISVMSVATLFLASLPGAVMLARGGLSPAIDASPR